MQDYQFECLETVTMATYIPDDNMWLAEQRLTQKRRVTLTSKIEEETVTFRSLKPDKDDAMMDVGLTATQYLAVVGYNLFNKV